MNEKARRGRERAEKMLRKEKRILEKCNLQQNLGQKKTCLHQQLTQKTMECNADILEPLRRDTSLPPTLKQLNGYIIASLGCPVQTPCINIELGAPI